MAGASIPLAARVAVPTLRAFQCLSSSIDSQSTRWTDAQGDSRQRPVALSMRCQRAVLGQKLPLISYRLRGGLFDYRLASWIATRQFYGIPSASYLGRVLHVLARV